MKHYWLSGAALAFAVYGGWQLPAHAQEEEPTADQAEDEQARLGTVTVSARKIEETLEDAPVAVSAIDEETLEQLTIQSGIDLVRQIPSATFVSAGPEYLADISIRGQGAGRLGFAESATGIYRNGVYVAGGGFGGRSFNRLDFFDVSTIETYRGPQSGLYGRNAVGGAVNVISNKPGFEPGGRLKAGYEDTERVTLEAVGNLPLSDVFAVRVGGYYVDQSDGFYTDVNTGETLDTIEYYGGRGAIRGRFGPSTEANLTVEFLNNDAPSFVALGERLPIDNGGVPIGGPAGPSDSDPSEFERNASNPGGRVEIEEISVLGDFSTDFGPTTFDLLFNYKDRDGARANDDLDHFLGFQGGFPGTELTVAQSEAFQRYTVEARLSSTDGERLTWLIGADAQGFESDVFLENGGTSVIGGLASLATRTEDTDEELESYSVFATAEYQFTDVVSVSVEGRVVNDTKTFSFARNQSGVDLINTGELEVDETRFLPGATLGLDFAEHGNVYLRFATGYRPFGFNTGVPDESFIPYDEEVVRSYEIGWKNSLANDRLDYTLAAFFMETDDPQLSTAISEEDTTTALQNVSGSEIYGLEAELNWRVPLGGGILAGGLSASTIQGEFDDDTSLLVSVGGTGIVEFDVSGARVPRTRDYIVALNSFYSWPVTPNVNAYIGGSIQSEGGGYENAVGDSPTRFNSGIPNTAFTGRSLDGFLLGDLRAGLNWDSWNAAVYVRNVGDEVYLLQNVLQNNYYNEPRKFGAEVTYRF